jgi:hypothetical protein
MDGGRDRQTNKQIERQTKMMMIKEFAGISMSD